MNYQKYINLGFKRTDTEDNVEFEETGYYGFVLEKKHSYAISVCVCSGELDRPKLYIKKQNKEGYHIILLTPEIVFDLFDNSQLIDERNTKE